MENLIMKIQKNAESTTHKMRIPLEAIEKFGLNYYMELYEDKIVLVPIKKEKEN